MNPRPLRSLFFFNDTAPSEIYTLSLHDALPISRQDELTCGISLNHVCVRLIMAADGEASRRSAGCARGSYRTAVLFDISSDAEFAVRAHREYCYRSPLVVGNELVLARRMDAYVRRARSLGTSRIQ